MTTPIPPGAPAPHVVAASRGNPRYHLDTAAGRWLVLGRTDPARLLAAHGAARFDDAHASLFALRPGHDVADRMPGLRCLADPRGAVLAAFGLAAGWRGWIAVDPEMRLESILPEAADIAAHVAALPPPGAQAGFEVQAPILVLPRVFPADLCARLIARYEAGGAALSGFMREVEGRTVGLQDARHKVRRDVELLPAGPDAALRTAAQGRIRDCVVPAIRKAHQFAATRMERYLVACYDAADGGHFAPHRDNTTSGTAHRRFAVSVNLNDGFDGGEVGFPEYGPRGFRAPAGGAVVFSCSLLHRVTKVTRGRRYAFLPFLYDDAAAAIRAANNARLGAGVTAYEAGGGAGGPA